MGKPFYTDSNYIRMMCYMGKPLYKESLCQVAIILELYGEVILQRISIWEGNYIRIIDVEGSLHKVYLWGSHSI